MRLLHLVISCTLCKYNLHRWTFLSSLAPSSVFLRDMQPLSLSNPVESGQCDSDMCGSRRVSEILGWEDGLRKVSGYERGISTSCSCMSGFDSVPFYLKTFWQHGKCARKVTSMTLAASDSASLSQCKGVLGHNRVSLLGYYYCYGCHTATSHNQYTVVCVRHL